MGHWDLGEGNSDVPSAKLDTPPFIIEEVDGQKRSSPIKIDTYRDFFSEKSIDAFDQAPWKISGYETGGDFGEPKNVIDRWFKRNSDRGRIPPVPQAPQGSPSGYNFWCRFIYTEGKPLPP